MTKKKLAVMFSGGRTSGRMSKWLIDNKSDEYDMTFVYSNTGQEHENTLKFIDQCDKAFRLNLHWIEADVKEKGVGTSYKIVDYETASRDGKPFEDIVKKFGLPNLDNPHCTREMKIEPFKKFAKDYIGKEYKIALGIRSDETKRATLGLKKKLKKQFPNKEFTIPQLIEIQYEEYNKYYPLILEKAVTKDDILLWWRKQNFDLDLHEHLGNCTWCWKKSQKKHLTLMKEHPEIFEFPKMLEEKYSMVSNHDKKEKRIMFREYLTTDDLRELSKKPFVEFKEKTSLQPSLNFEEEECAEECGSVWND